jgi:hypothetical protein
VFFIFLLKTLNFIDASHLFFLVLNFKYLALLFAFFVENSADMPGAMNLHTTNATVRNAREI